MTPWELQELERRWAQWEAWHKEQMRQVREAYARMTEEAELEAQWSLPPVEEPER